MSKEDFLNRIRLGATKGWLTYGIYPSIAMAQAILESGWGKSKLAVESNNLFGIKAGSNWTGKKRNYPTKEHDKSDKPFWVDAYFRVYDSWDDSIEGHGEFFTSTNWKKENYKAVLEAKDYKEQAWGLQSSGYATDKQYANKLLSIIDNNNLTKYDVPQIIEEGIEVGTPHETLIAVTPSTEYAFSENISYASYQITYYDESRYFIGGQMFKNEGALTFKTDINTHFIKIEASIAINSVDMMSVADDKVNVSIATGNAESIGIMKQRIEDMGRLINELTNNVNNLT